ncbi:hypothetical protein BT96DRAFT_1020515 [Gymnopus androsaceus JB14]|uniref:Uncharacterized protein n=1 Tax=Gymnopus androsaceus JB14 TaxID=1447944 RepID=A0A6A4HLX4_9AGAR|nr:hypothetical protein BT96DRAFT_1020515 [Gymnopus androsaceus JB14]
MKTTPSSQSSLVSRDPLDPNSEGTTPKRSQLMMAPESSPAASRLDAHNHTKTRTSSNAMDSTSRSRLSSPFVAESFFLRPQPRAFKRIPLQRSSR